jgi:two-component system, LytTR family, sensor kinase
MKKIFLIALFSLGWAAVFGQVDFEKYMIGSLGHQNAQPIGFVAASLDIGLYTVGLELRDAYPQLADTIFEARFKDGHILKRVDTSDTHLFVRGINRANAKDYEFRTLDNKQKIISDWHEINQFASETTPIRDNLPKGMAYLGAYKTEWNHYMAVEIRKKGTTNLVAQMAIYGQQTIPAFLNIYTHNGLNEFLSTTKQSFPLGLSPDERKYWTDKYAPEDLDRRTHLPKKLILESDENDVIFLFNATAFPKQALEHKVMKNGQVLSDWQPHDNYNNFISFENLPYGDYKLLVRYAIQRHNVLEYPFEIKPKWYQTNRFQAIMGTLSLFIPMLLIGLFVFFKQKNKIKKQALQNEKIAQELKAIRSQLNPHFVFNALNSIQGLMNKNDLTHANFYLTEFSTLLRDSLANNEKENVPLSIELKNLETYIKLEQLRFPFTYAIEIDKALDIYAIEIPYLLLQPLVENAIKHGVSHLYEKGVLAIRIYPQTPYLIVEINDNGKGFDTQTPTQGYGLKLTKERVRLLAESNKEQPVKLLVKSDLDKGTSAYLTFKNWM